VLPASSFFSHVAGELWSLAPSFDATCHHLGGDLHPPLEDVHGRVTVSVPALALLHAVSLQKERKQPGGLQLPP
jgi:hypothetical protein